MDPNDPLLIGLAVALGCGLLIGIERERRKGTGATRSLAGVRTFALAAIAGAMAQALAQPWLVGIGALLILALAAIAYWRDRSTDPGITTEVALFVTFLLGVTAIERPVFAGGVAVVVAGLLAVRTRLHQFSTEVLTQTELRDGLLLAGAALVVLPLVQDRSITWLAGVNPRNLWLLVVLLMALQAAGYVALRLAGPRLGLALSGLAAGFVSSTVTIAAMGARARKDPGLLAACVSGALFSTVATIVQLALVSLAIYPPALGVMAPSLIAALIAALAAAGLSLLEAHETDTPGAPEGRAFSLWQALSFAVILSAVTAAVALANEYWGSTAVGIGAALGGLADAHAGAASVLSLAASGAIDAAAALAPLLLAFSTNTFSKLVMAWISGGWRYTLRVAAGLIAVALAAWLPLLFR